MRNEPESGAIASRDVDVVHGRGLGQRMLDEDLSRLAVDGEDPGVVAAHDLVRHLRKKIRFA